MAPLFDGNRGINELYKKFEMNVHIALDNQTGAVKPGRRSDCTRSASPM
jgi:hypothetical protein